MIGEPLRNPLFILNQFAIEKLVCCLRRPNGARLYTHNLDLDFYSASCSQVKQFVNSVCPPCAYLCLFLLFLFHVCSSSVEQRLTVSVDVAGHAYLYNPS